MNCSTPQHRLRACRIGLQLVALGFIALAVPLPVAQAQVTAPAADPRVTADATRCLAIDTETAELNAQARSGAISAEVRKLRADALTAERTRITTAYGSRNSPASRALVAEYNRLKAAAAAEARAEAAAEAKAKREAAAAAAQAKREAAAAEAQARHEAAAAEQQAKREAAAAVAAEQARLAALAEEALDADVSRVANERLQRARDRFFHDFGLPAPNTPAAAGQQAAAAQTVRAGHVPPAVAELRPPFDQRVERIYQLRLPDRTKEWFAEAFPPDADLVAQFPDPTRCSAALEIAARRLAEHTTGVRPAEAHEKIEAYQVARARLQADPAQVMRLAGDTAFEAEVFEKSLPAYSASLRQQAAREKAAQEFKAFQTGVATLTGFMSLGVLAVFAVLPVFLMGRQKFRWKKQSRADWERQMASSPLPEELWWVQVPGFRYPVTLFSGRVYDKDIWTETNVTTTTTTTGGGGSGYGYAYSPGQTTTSTHVSTTVYHRYWMVTTTGEQTWHKYSDNEFLATSGQKVSSIWSDNYWVVLAYNHATGSISAPAWWTRTMHRPPYWGPVALTALAGIAVAAGIAVTGWPLLRHMDLNSGEQSGVLVDRATSALGPPLLLLLAYAAIVRAIVTWRRGRHFQNQVLPVYLAFLRAYDPAIPETAREKPAAGS